MHYGNLVIIKKPNEVNEETVGHAVQNAMQPGEDVWWDWYQIGGRWTGALDGYDASTDPRNVVKCEWCGGTGDRTDLEPPEKCNGCKGTGTRTTWPTEWGFHPGDVQPVESLTEEQIKLFYRVVIEGWGTFGGDHYEPWNEGEKTFVKHDVPSVGWLKREFSGWLAVVVDSHD